VCGDNYFVTDSRYRGAYVNICHVFGCLVRSSSAHTARDINGSKSSNFVLGQLSVFDGPTLDCAKQQCVRRFCAQMDSHRATKVRQRHLCGTLHELCTQHSVSWWQHDGCTQCQCIGEHICRISFRPDWNVPNAYMRRYLQPIVHAPADATDDNGSARRACSRVH